MGWGWGKSQKWGVGMQQWVRGERECGGKGGARLHTSVEHEEDRVGGWVVVMGVGQDQK